MSYFLPKVDKSKSPFLTVNEAAEYLQVHQMTVYRLLKTKKLNGFKVGGKWRFDKQRMLEGVKND